jgi:acyl-CoA synthetase (NDP forming)
MPKTHPLDYLFYPRSIAVVGVSTRPSDWGGGNMFLSMHQESGFAGPIYPVNPHAEEIMGLKCYPSLTAIPGSVDHVISSIPSTGVLQLVDDAVAKKVRCIHFFTAGFRETGEQDRAELERKVLEKARAAGIRLVGPNCMGLYCPASGLTFGPDFPKEPGDVAFISQSGLNGEDLVRHAALCGLRFSKAVSYGNAADLDESDFFEYCAADPETKIITAYIEGIKDGPRFRRALAAASAAKPVIVLKGGLTSAGSRAANSHTGSMAGSPQVWNALCRQTRVVSAESLEELVDMAITFSRLRRPAGRGIAVIGVGGGASVMIADRAEKMGLPLPEISDEVQAELRKFTPLAGTSIRNPLDTVALQDSEGLNKTVNIVARSPGIHAILILPRLDWGLDRTDDMEGFVKSNVDLMAESVSQSSVPVALAVRAPDDARSMAALELFYRFAAQAQVATYPDFPRALNAISKFIAWHEDRDDR